MQSRHSRVHGTGYFFFQAEDGIRDDLVTGVQTCALPISATLAGAIPTLLNPSYREREIGYQLENSGAAFLITDAPLLENVRSEERRVGKECRSRWSPYH